MMNQAVADPTEKSTATESLVDQADAGSEWEDSSVDASLTEAPSESAEASSEPQSQPDHADDGDAGATVPDSAEDSGERTNLTDDPDSIEDYQAEVERFLAEPAPEVVVTEADSESTDADVADAAEAEPEPEKAPQFRLRPRSPIGEEAFRLMKADPYLTEEEAFEQAKAALGQSSAVADDTPAATADPASEDAADDQPPGTLADLRTQIRELKLKAIQAERDYDAEAKADAEEAILTLEDRIPELQRAEAEAEQKNAEAEEAWMKAAQQSRAVAIKQYPLLNDPESPFAKRVNEIDEAWQEAGDDRFFEPQKAEMIAAIVGKELGVKPSQSQKPGRSLPAPGSVRSSEESPALSGAVAMRPASGAARTNAPDTREAQVLREIEQTSDPDDFQVLVERLRGAA